MASDKPRNTSPFSALSYQEQQDQWLAWRSQQLEYHDASVPPPAPAAPPPPKEEALPPLRLPQFQRPAPTRHGELDKIQAKHRQAARTAAAWQPTAHNEAVLK